MTKTKIAVIAILIFSLGLVFIFMMKIPREVNLTETQMNEYNKYKITITQNTTKQDILALCEEIERRNIDDINFVKYSSDQIEPYLNNFKEMIEIVEINEKLYVEYKTTDGLMVYLKYMDYGFHSIDITKKDTVVSINNEGGKIYKNYINGIKFSGFDN
jgi:hypothetical protein